MKFAIGAAAMALALAGFALAGGSDRGGDDRGRVSSSTTTAETTTTADRFDDRNRRGHKAKKGKPHRKNARILRNRVRERGEDVRGPCDEAEHANDPRCTGAAGSDDHSGPGRSGRGSDDD